MNKIIKEIKTIWIDGGFTAITIAALLTAILVYFMPPGNSTINKCFYLI
jgi:hypothetical protein